MGVVNFIPFQNVLQSYGINHRITCPYFHAQNGSIEQWHHHIVETGLALLTRASMPFKYWSAAFQTAVFLINWMPTSILQNKFPFQKLFNRSPDYHFLKTFGASCWPNLHSFNKHKMDFHSKFYVFMGYSLDHKDYCCLHLSSDCTYISRDVLFHKNQFPFASVSGSRDVQNQIGTISSFCPTYTTAPIFHFDTHKITAPMHTSKPNPMGPSEPPAHWPLPVPTLLSYLLKQYPSRA